MGAPSTQSESVYESGGDEKPVPGALLVFSGNAPMTRPIRVAPGPVTLGRDDAGGAPLPDEKVSRQHCELIFDGPGWTVRDLGSRNGTLLDGRKIEGESRAASNTVLKLAQTLFVLCDDVRRFHPGAVTNDEMVIGPTLRAALDRIADAARRDSSVLVGGESGAGKELAARTFHEATGKSGPFVAVNCANIPGPLAERLLFGAVKGVATDVKTDADGHVQAADGGTLFLDEIGDLDLAVQAKLLRVVEQREVARLGETQARKVNVRFVAATHKDLRSAVDAGTFRFDLWQRLNQCSVRLPPLRERREEIPWLIAAALAGEAVRVAHASLVEAALLRAWPGNVRELLSAMKKASAAAAAEGSKSVRSTHLDDEAGVAPSRALQVKVAAAAPASAFAPTPAPQQPTKEEVVKALEMAGGKIAAAARQLGQHRTQLYRLMDRYGLKREADAE